MLFAAGATFTLTRVLLLGMALDSGVGCPAELHPRLTQMQLLGRARLNRTESMSLGRKEGFQGKARKEPLI
jgi:hypothetical protein